MSSSANGHINKRDDIVGLPKKTFFILFAEVQHIPPLIVSLPAEVVCSFEPSSSNESLVAYQILQVHVINHTKLEQLKKLVA